MLMTRHSCLAVSFTASNFEFSVRSSKRAKDERDLIMDQTTRTLRSTRPFGRPQVGSSDPRLRAKWENCSNGGPAVVRIVTRRIQTRVELSWPTSDPAAEGVGFLPVTQGPPEQE